MTANQLDAIRASGLDPDQVPASRLRAWVAYARGVDAGVTAQARAYLAAEARREAGTELAITVAAHEFPALVERIVLTAETAESDDVAAYEHPEGADLASITVVIRRTASDAIAQLRTAARDLLGDAVRFNTEPPFPLGTRAAHLRTFKTSGVSSTSTNRPTLTHEEQETDMNRRSKARSKKTTKTVTRAKSSGKKKAAKKRAATPAPKKVKTPTAERQPGERKRTSYHVTEKPFPAEDKKAKGLDAIVLGFIKKKDTATVQDVQDFLDASVENRGGKETPFSANSVGFSVWKMTKDGYLAKVLVAA